MTPADLDAIKARAKAREYVCEASQRDPVTGAYPPPCGAVATQRCVAGGDCGAWACDAHAAPFFAACDHRWERVDEGAEDIAALVAEVRRLRAIVEGREAAPTVEEAQAHIDAGGSFRVVSANGGAYSAGSALAVDLAVEDFPGCRWWALDANGTPCAWPEVKP